MTYKFSLQSQQTQFNTAGHDKITWDSVSLTLTPLTLQRGHHTCLALYLFLYRFPNRALPPRTMLKVLLALLSATWGWSLNQFHGCRSVAMVGCVLKTLMTNFTALSAIAFTNTCFLSYSNIYLMSFWIFIHDLNHGSPWASRRCLRTANNLLLFFFLQIFQISNACLLWILCFIGIKPASHQTKTLEVAAGTCRIKRPTIHCIRSSANIYNCIKVSWPPPY